MSTPSRESQARRRPRRASPARRRPPRQTAALRVALAVAALVATAALPAAGAGAQPGAPASLGIAGLEPGGSSPASAARRAAKPFVPGEVLVRLEGERRERTFDLPPDLGVRAASRALEETEHVAYAVPNYVARASGRFIPDDPGSTGVAGGWRRDQWNFLGGAGGVRATRAWFKLNRRGRPGGSRRGGLGGPIVAVLDTGIAFTENGPFQRSPDFGPDQFTGGHDFVNDDEMPLDEHGHGTHVAGTIAEQADNGLAVTGLAYGARLMPVRVLDANGGGDAEDIRDGILWAIQHRAKVINLSLEFDPTVTSCEQIEGVCEAIAKARSQRTLVVASAGNLEGAGGSAVTYPARAALAVGATTVRGCLARYSGSGRGLDIVAPGGGRDAALPGDPRCDPTSEETPDIVQLSFDPRGQADFDEFVLVARHGTSMAAAHVTGVAAMTLASRVLHRKRHPPGAGRLERHLERTARELGPEPIYGAGLVDAAAALQRPR